ACHPFAVRFGHQPLLGRHRESTLSRRWRHAFAVILTGLRWPARSAKAWHPPHVWRLAPYLLALTALGCSYGISVRRTSGPDLLHSWRASIIEADDLSPRTRQTLYRLDLDGLYRRSPPEVYVRLQSMVVEDSQPDLLFALAEISYLLGRKAEKWES